MRRRDHVTMLVYLHHKAAPIANGDNRPYRVRTRPPSMYNLQALKQIAIGNLIADVVVMIGSLDPVFGEVDR